METKKREEKTKEIHACNNKTIIRRCPHANWIPFDLTREILLSLPSKSLMRFRCVSKLWASTTSDPDFITSFTKRSSTRRPCLIVNFQKSDKQIFFSFPQQKNLKMCNLSHVEKYYLTLPKEYRYAPNFQFQSVHGLISFHYWHHVLLWNPTMRQYLTFHKPGRLVFGLPMLTKSYLGYDPIGRTYKLLSMSGPSTHDDPRVLTLGAGESWRQIKDIPQRFLSSKGICISGILFIAVMNEARKDIMSFDVRTEKFKLIRTHCRMPNDDLYTNPSLVSYKGKLAWVILEEASLFYKLWILEDAEKEEWSCQDFHIPLSPEDDGIVKVFDYSLSGVTDDGEFIYVSVSWQDKEIYVSYYDPEKKSNRMIKLEKFEDDDFWLRNGCRDGDWEFLGSISDHIENLMSLNNITC